MKGISLIGGSLLVALCVGVVAGCDTEDTKRYDVNLNWNIAGAETCSMSVAGEDLVFDEVEITVYKKEGDPEPIQDPVRVPCTDYGYEVNRLKRGTYFVELDAYATDSDGDYIPYFQAEGGIRAPAESDMGYDFGLALGKGEIMIRWGFADYGWCDSNGVSDLDISLVSELVACADETYLMEDVAWQEWTLTIDGLDEDGDVVKTGAYNDGDPFLVKPGQSIDALVVLDDPS